MQCMNEHACKINSMRGADRIVLYSPSCPASLTSYQKEIESQPNRRPPVWQCVVLHWWCPGCTAAQCWGCPSLSLGLVQPSSEPRSRSPCSSLFQLFQTSEPPAQPEDQKMKQSAYRQKINIILNSIKSVHHSTSTLSGTRELSLLTISKNVPACADNRRASVSG